MRAVLIGCAGRMGQAVLAIAAPGEIVAGVDIVKCGNVKTYSDIKEVQEEFDTIIDFSTCADRQEMIDFAREKMKCYACFATALNKVDRPALLKLEKEGLAVVCANASEGFFAMKKAIEVMTENLTGADVVVEEVHHKQKKDVPSGTAKMLVKILKENGAKPQGVSVRAGSEFGTHKVVFYLQDETIEIVHRAQSRKIFAIGALKSARELANKNF